MNPFFVKPTGAKVHAMKWINHDQSPHSRVQRTSYMEVHQILGTSGCSRESPYWTWNVMGVIEQNSGKQLISPGDWLVLDICDRLTVYTEKDFKALFGSAE